MGRAAGRGGPLWSRRVSEQEAAAGPQPCPPCSGTGKVISNLGGTPSTIDCPWCEGSGVFLPEHDAQEHWRAGRTSDGDAA